jgi:hypothetical protein
VKQQNVDNATNVPMARRLDIKTFSSLNRFTNARDYACPRSIRPSRSGDLIQCHCSPRRARLAVWPRFIHGSHCQGRALLRGRQISHPPLGQKSDIRKRDTARNFQIDHTDSTIIGSNKFWQSPEFITTNTLAQGLRATNRRMVATCPTEGNRSSRQMIFSQKSSILGGLKPANVAAETGIGQGDDLLSSSDGCHGLGDP